MKGSYFDLKLSEFRLLVLLSETHSIRELARRENIQPSQVSKAIKKIEEKLQTQILQRSALRVSFTLEGMELLKIAKGILEASKGLLPKKNLSALNSPIVTLSSLSFFNQFLIPGCINSMRKRNSNLRVRVLEIASKDLIVSGIKGYFEMSLHIGKLDWPRTWVSKEVGKMHSGLYVRADHKLQTDCSESDLLNERFVIPLRWTNNGIQTGEDNCPLPMSQRLHGDGAESAGVALSLIQHTDQLAYLPYIVAKELLNKKIIKQINVKEWSSDTKSLFLSVHSEKVSQNVFIDFIKELEVAIK